MMHTIKRRKGDVNLEMRRCANLLGALATALADEMEEAATAVLGRGPSMAAAIASIGAHPGSSIGELSLAVGASHSATVRIVDLLEAEGLVRRGACFSDARRLELSLTPAGAELFHTLADARIAALGRRLEALGPADRRTLHRLLDALLAPIATDAANARHVCRFCDHAICRGPDCPVGRPFI